MFPRQRSIIRLIAEYSLSRIARFRLSNLMLSCGRTTPQDYPENNDGIILCREPPAAVNEGEIVVTSNEELHAAQLSGKRLLALWNALPDVERRKKVGDRDALVDELWSAIETLPEPQSDEKRPSKQDAVIAMLRRP